MTFQKAGGWAAIAMALTYIIGFAIFVFFLDIPGGDDLIANLSYFIDNKGLIQAAMALIYVVAALILVVLVLALHERLKPDASAAMQVATAIGLIWAGVVAASGMIFITGFETVAEMFADEPERAATIWESVGIVQDGLGGGIELLGGVWIFIVSWIALKAGKLSKPLNWLGLLIGIVGILTIIPTLGDLADIFGLSQIIWFIWVGGVMLRVREGQS